MPIERITHPLLIVLSELLEQPDVEHHGYAIAKRTNLFGGRVHQLLTRLEAEGWLTSRREDIDPVQVGRPTRRLYRFTEVGLRAAAKLHAENAHRLYGSSRR
jgi:PadR family transcriptional regulator, regulatory protein PadR